MGHQGRIAFDNSYARLPERFYARLDPAPVPAPRLIALNRGLAEVLGLDAAALERPEGVAMLAGNAVPEGAEPIATAYAGHQFGNWVPQLGDGRAILLGEVVGRDGIRRDIQLKGAGRTPFSRMGDGKAALGPVLREYIVSEAMAALGIPTTRALAAVLTGETVLREGPLPGAVLTRVARSHIRVGTFQFFYARDDLEGLRLLARHVIDRHYPEAAGAERPALALLEAVVAAQARLIARWMGAGFIHGVMNTDNMSIAGETIDYGPCAFMDAFHPATVYSSIDRYGRYAWGNQPRIAHWNLAQLAQCLLPLIAETPEAALPHAQAAVDRFAGLYAAAWAAELARKLGLGAAREGDAALGADLLKVMEDNGADFTLTFRHLATGDLAAARAQFTDAAAFEAWRMRWQARLAAEGRGPAAAQAAMRAANPAFIPRNHRVEQAIETAMAGDLGPFGRLNAVLARPFEDQPEAADLMAPPAPHEVVRATFCGT
jgi:uncharacterized protein YdiU (UPF0061 family)